jgi:DNA (cytosine-5)-methyltransferase 1
MQKIGFISLFSGAGGLDIGLEQSGFSCLYSADVDEAAFETLKENKRRNSLHLRDAVIEQADVSRANGDQILSKLGLARGDVPLLVGGPPCQSWSSAGRQEGFMDPRGRLFDDFVRMAGELEVRWLLFENVRGLLTARGPDGVPGSALELIRKRLLAAGFQTQVALLNAADYGVPQRRVRLVVFGFRVGDKLDLPAATHSKAGSPAWVSAAHALEAVHPLFTDEIIRPNTKLLEQLANLRAGTGVKSPGKAEATRPGGHWGYKQGAFIADTNLPARTVTANPQQDWVIDPSLGIRRLCPRECAALQTFPSKWIFLGKRADQYRLIGNAVPPRLARVIGVSLHRHISTFAGQNTPSLQVLQPLDPSLQAAIAYTAREEARNGESRRSNPMFDARPLADLKRVAVG